MIKTDEKTNGEKWIAKENRTERCEIIEAANKVVKIDGSLGGVPNIGVQ